MTNRIHIELDLSKNCIETAIKKVYNQSISDYFNKETDLEKLEPIIALTKHALEHFDFPRLRSTHKELAGKTGHHVHVIKEDGIFAISIDGRCIEPIMKKFKRQK